MITKTIRNRMATLDRLDLLDKSFNQSIYSAEKVVLSIKEEKLVNATLLKAGYISREEQKGVLRIRNVILILSFIIGLFSGVLFKKSILAALVVSVISLYFALVGWTLWLKSRTNDVVRSAYYDLPLILEEMILLIESGLGLFPALEKVCSFKEGDFIGADPGICRKYFRKAYQLAVGGLPVGQAFEVISRSTDCAPLKQVLIHLDVSASVGGELLSSLKSLSEQVHKEWKLNVETRVKRLENLVVFPVFLAVMGLLLLTAAVPLVPVLDFMSGLKNNSSGLSAEQNVSSLGSIK